MLRILPKNAACCQKSALFRLPRNKLKLSAWPAPLWHEKQSRLSPRNTRPISDVISSIPVQPIHTFIVVGICPETASRGNVSDRIIECQSGRETSGILGCRRDEVGENLIVRAVHLQPLLCPGVKRGHTRAEQLTPVICPFVGK